MLNLGMRNTKQETTAPQKISFHRTPQIEKHKQHKLRTPTEGLGFLDHRNTENPHVPLL